MMARHVVRTDNLLTPNELFFVRNHLPVPVVDGPAHRVTVDVGGGGEPVVLSVKDLQTNYPAYTITAAVQCGGNRRSEMNTLKPVKGAQCRRCAHD